MKTTRFTTTIEDLKLIIEDSKDLNFKMEVENRPNHRDVLVEIIAEEDVIFDFIGRNFDVIDRNQLSQCICIAETIELA